MTNATIQHYINGEISLGTSSQSQDVFNPATGQVTGRVALAGREDVDAAVAAGADCVKFQLRDRTVLYRSKADGSQAEDLGVEYIQDLLDKVELSLEEHRQLRAYCASRNILYICTPWDESSVDLSLIHI